MGPGNYWAHYFALELTVSESALALQCDAKIWLEHPKSHATQVVTVKISRTRPEIIFSIWKATLDDRETRALHPQRASLPHDVRVTPSPRQTYSKWKTLPLVRANFRAQSTSRNIGARYDVFHTGGAQLEEKVR